MKAEFAVIVDDILVVAVGGVKKEVMVGVWEVRVRLPSGNGIAREVKRKRSEGDNAEHGDNEGGAWSPSHGFPEER